MGVYKWEDRILSDGPVAYVDWEAEDLTTWLSWHTTKGLVFMEGIDPSLFLSCSLLLSLSPAAFIVIFLSKVLCTDR